jgi:uncharacterized protein YfdQ (DUF2303 family)
VEEKEKLFLDHAIDYGRATAPVVNVPGFKPFILVPDRFETRDLENMREFPSHITQAVTVYNVPSFIEYFTAFFQPGVSRVFLDMYGPPSGKDPKLLAVLDYHQPEEDAGKPDSARWCDHKLEFAFRPTREWETWKRSDRQDMSQETFARFIEDNLPDIIEPAAAEMFEVARSLDAKKSVDFSSAVRLTNGEVQFKYSETIAGSAQQGNLTIPEQFVLAIAPFEGSELYKLNARFRYRFSDKGLYLRYELVRPHKVAEDAVNTVVQQLEEGLKEFGPVTILRGKLA